MKNSYTNKKPWILGLALCCFSLVGISNFAVAAGGGPANDLCANAEAIECGDVVAGTNVGATEQNIPNVGSTVGQGVWYSFVGTGGDITLSVCDDATFDSEINVVTSTDCINFTFIAGNDDGASCTGGTSEVTFTSVAGQEYYAYVSDWISGGTDVGTFNLTMTCAAPANDLCAGALSVACGDVITGNTDAATATDAATGMSEGVWYVFAGNGDDVTVSTCGTADFDTEISVSEGACGALTDVASNDDFTGCAGNTSEVTFSSVSGTDYYIYVGDWSTTVGGTNTGTFDLSITCVTPPPGPANDLCANAEAIECGDVLAGTNVGATEQNIPNVGSTVGQGVWYSFVGTGGDITLSVCDDATFDSEINVVTSTDCINFTFIAGNDDGASCTGGTSEVTFTSVAGQEYYAYVSDWISGGTDVGTFNLTMTCAAPANDLCAGALSVACGDVITGNTDAATATDAATGMSEGVWYVFAGNGDDVTISTCGTADFDTEISVSEGTCGALTDVASNDDFGGCVGNTSEVTFSSVSGTDYYIYVGDWSTTVGGTNTGTFDLSITCVTPPPGPANDDVCSAQALTIGANGPYSNIAATADLTDPTVPSATDGCYGDDGWCVDTDVENSVWFTFVAPASGNVIVSANGSDFDTQLAVYEAVSCQDFASGTQVLVGANDDLSGALTFGNSEVNLCGLTAGATYFVLVDGYSGAEGDILLTLTETTVDASFTYVATGLSVEFTDASTTSSTITDYAWDFGDLGTDATAGPVTHVFAADGPYTVCLTVTDENGCTSEYCEGIQVADIATTITEAIERGMEVYPNPSNGQFVVSVTGVEADAQIIVMDVAGRQVYTEGVAMNESFRKELNLDVAKGTYLLQIATVEGTVTRKIQIH